MPSTDHIDAAAPDWVAHVPPALFGAVMGLFGLTLALHAAGPALAMASDAVRLLSFGTLLLVLALYGRKLLQAPAAALADWHHPVRSVFFSGAAIALLLAATALVHDLPGLARPLWATGTLLQGTVSLLLVARWIGPGDMPLDAFTPAHFIPAVGNIVVPLAGMPLGYPEVSWLFFSAGLGFWGILLPLVMMRLMTGTAMPPLLQPTVAILMAPPAVAALALAQLTGGHSPTGQVLLDLGYVLAALAILRLALHPLPGFSLGWWATTFPTAALSVASFRHAALTGAGAYHLIGAGLLLALVLLVAGLTVRTLRAAARHALFVPH